MARFESVEFMTSDQKARVMADWARFLKTLAQDDAADRNWNAFTEKLYHHLTQHCSYIAHYNRRGFYETYFADPEDTPKFLQQFDSGTGNKSWEYRSTWWLKGDYADINRAMCDEFDRRKRPIYEAIRRRVRVKKEREIARLQGELEELQ